jgi:hypothetical protein
MSIDGTDAAKLVVEDEIKNLTTQLRN